MANPAVMEVPRFERRRLLAAEASCRKSGEWGEWETIDFPDGGFSGCGWLRDVRQVRKNRVFCVLIRPHHHGVHLAVSSLSGVRPGWREMQRIKDDILGSEATAVEVYPPSSQVVDEADMFHIWGVDPLPFSLFYKR